MGDAVPKPREAIYPGLELTARMTAETPREMVEEIESAEEMDELRSTYHDAVEILDVVLGQIVDKKVEGLDEAHEIMAAHDIASLIIKTRAVVDVPICIRKMRVQVSQEIGEIFKVEIDQNLWGLGEKEKFPVDEGIELHLQAMLTSVNDPDMKEQMDIYILEDGTAHVVLDKAPRPYGPELPPEPEGLAEMIGETEPMVFITEKAIREKVLARFKDIYEYTKSGRRRKKWGKKGIYVGPKFDFAADPNGGVGNAMLYMVLTSSSSMQGFRGKKITAGRPYPQTHEEKMEGRPPRDVQWDAFDAHVAEITNPDY